MSERPSESGRSKDRPQLKEALRLCRIYNAKLIIARLDRLAAVAEYEAHLISDQTKAAFAAAQAAGRKFGNPMPETHGFSDAARKARVRAESERSKSLALDFAPLLCHLRDRDQTINEIAQRLTTLGVPTPRGGNAWVTTQ